MRSDYILLIQNVIFEDMYKNTQQQHFTHMMFFDLSKYEQSHYLYSLQ